MSLSSVLSWYCLEEGGVGADGGTCICCGAGEGDDVILLVGVADLGTDFVTGGSGLGQAACANRSSISFSCFNAFTNAVFNLQFIVS